MEGEKKLSTIEKVLFLKFTAIFEHASIEELGRVAAVAEEVRFGPGETIYREGYPVDAVHMILEGGVGVFKDEQLVREIGEGHPIGVLAALEMNSALRTVKALQPVRALKITVQDFQDALSSDFELVKAVFRVLVEHIRQGF
ncbi:MAG TPA: cyclic nucleotide-binding domain-containing protein [Candidatus Binatia bacterium]|jgi:CRP-like cAMP-binding protein|nr:cyclic nucleotide-binding domain-containing protein [Candidatus Binatia bacterium]